MADVQVPRAARDRARPHEAEVEILGGEGEVADVERAARARVVAEVDMTCRHVLRQERGGGAECPAGVVLPTKALSFVPGTALPLQVSVEDQSPGEEMTARSAAASDPLATTIVARA